jgi:hypothetical protein
MNHDDVVWPTDKDFACESDAVRFESRPGNCSVQIKLAPVICDVPGQVEAELEVSERLIAARFDSRGQEFLLDQTLGLGVVAFKFKLPRSG